MKKITVGDAEYFVDEELFTAGDMEKIISLQKENKSDDLSEFCQVLAKRCLGSDVYSSIPMCDFPEVYAKTLAEIFFNEDNRQKEEMVKNMLSNLKK